MLQTDAVGRPLAARATPGACIVASGAPARPRRSTSHVTSQHNPASSSTLPGGPRCRAAAPCKPGFGGSVKCAACSAGFWSQGGTAAEPLPPCRLCPSGFSTLRAGANSSAHCTGERATPQASERALRSAIQHARGRGLERACRTHGRRARGGWRAVGATGTRHQLRALTGEPAPLLGQPAGRPPAFSRRAWPPRPCKTETLAPDTCPCLPACRPVCAPGFGGPSCEACKRGAFSPGGNASVARPGCSPCGPGTNTPYLGASSAADCAPPGGRTSE